MDVVTTSSQQSEQIFVRNGLKESETSVDLPDEGKLYRRTLLPVDCAAFTIGDFLAPVRLCPLCSLVILYAFIWSRFSSSALFFFARIY
jgi:hypothetical protein